MIDLLKTVQDPYNWEVYFNIYGTTDSRRQEELRFQTLIKFTTKEKARAHIKLMGLDPDRFIYIKQA